MATSHTPKDAPHTTQQNENENEGEGNHTAAREFNKAQDFQTSPRVAR